MSTVITTTILIKMIPQSVRIRTRADEEARQLYNPVRIKTRNDGSATMLNLLPTLIIIERRSSILFVIEPSIGARIKPRKIEPPTHIEAQIKYNQIIKTSMSGI